MSCRLTHRQPDGGIFSMRFLFPDHPSSCQVDNDKNLTRTGPNLFKSCALWLGRCKKALAVLSWQSVVGENPAQGAVL